MTFVDGIIIVIVLGGLVIGFSKGLIRQAASLVSWGAGIAVCYCLREQVTALFQALVPSSAHWPLAGITVQTVALAVAFLLISLAVRLLMRIFKGLLNVTRMGCVDRWGGAALFVFKYLFVLSIVLNLLYAINPDMETFGTRHALNNKPFEFTLDLMPRVLGSDEMPSDSLKLYRDLIEPIPDVATMPDGE